MPSTSASKARSRRGRVGRALARSASPAAPLAGFPPVRLLSLLSPELQRAERTHRASAAQVAELPQLPSGLLVMVDQLVQLEHVDLASVQASEALPDSYEQQPQLLLVIRRDHLPRRASPSSLRLPTLVAGLAHTRRVIAAP